MTSDAPDATCGSRFAGMLSTNHVKLAEFVELPQPVRAKRNAAASTAAVKRNHRFKKNNLIPFIFAQKRQKTLCNDKCSRKQQKKQLPFCEFTGLFEADCAVFRCQLRANGL